MLRTGMVVVILKGIILPSTWILGMCQRTSMGAMSIVFVFGMRKQRSLPLAKAIRHKRPSTT